MATGWAKSIKIGKRTYTHVSTYYTTVRREADREAKRWGKMNMDTKIVKKLMPNSQGVARFVYSVYVSNKKKV